MEARRLAALADVQLGVSPFILARELGLKIDLCDTPDGLGGFIIRGHPTIYVNRRLEFAEASFVVAHELFEHTLADRLPGWAHEFYCDAGAEALNCAP